MKCLFVVRLSQKHFISKSAKIVDSLKDKTAAMFSAFFILYQPNCDVPVLNFKYMYVNQMQGVRVQTWVSS